MATPENRDINRRRPEEIDDLGQRPGWNGPGGGRLAFWWIWLLLIAIGFFWFAGWGWGPYGGWWWGRPEVRMQPQTTGSGLAVLASNNRSAYIGKTFDLRNATVEREVNDRVFWIGNVKADSSPMLLVVTGSAANNVTQPAIVPGDLIAATGTVQKAPPQMQARQEWNLNDQGAQRLEQQQAYLQAQYVTKLHRERAGEGPAPNRSVAANTPPPANAQR